MLKKDVIKFNNGFRLLTNFPQELFILVKRSPELNCLLFSFLSKLRQVRLQLMQTTGLHFSK